MLKSLRTNLSVYFKVMLTNNALALPLFMFCEHFICRLLFSIAATLRSELTYTCNDKRVNVVTCTPIEGSGVHC
jgi:hypothetical protein